MLTPEQIQKIADTLLPMLDGLNAWIMKDMIRRLMARIGRGEEAMLTASDEWQAQVLQEAGGHLEDVRAEIQRVLPLTDDEVARIFEDAAIKSLEADNRVYIQAGGRKLGLSRRMIEILTDTYQRTKGTLHNLTRTTAENSQRKLIQLLDSAHMRVYTGAQSYTAAVSETVKELCDTQTKILYPSGHTDTIETAVLRAVRTGTAQAAGNMSLQGMEENGWDLVRVSAHIGARYGDGGQNPGNHFWWQGKLYSKSGRNKRYPPFVETTGYGTGEGLCGWNCRHSFGPGDPDHNPFKDFDAEENKRVYDLSQRQRAMERRIRHTKAKLVTLREGINAAEDAGVKAELEEEYSRTAQQLGEQNAAYNTFCKDNGLKRLSDRIQIAKWTRADARKAMSSARKTNNALENSPESGIIQHIRDEVIPNMKTDTIVPRQRVHRVGTREYLDRQQKLLKEGQYGPSYVTISDDEILKLVNQFKGTGKIRLRKMKWDNQEIITTNETVVGVVVNNKTGKAIETTVFKIHYGKKGVHIVPDYPSKKE